MIWKVPYIWQCYQTKFIFSFLKHIRHLLETKAHIAKVSLKKYLYFKNLLKAHFYNVKSEN